MCTVGLTGQQKRYGRALRVILHIGLPKTGSTFLQHWLVANEDALANSVAVISGDQGAQLLAQLCCDRDRFAHRPDFAANSNDEAIRTLLARLASLRDRNAARVVISSEYFFLAEPGMIRTTLLQFGLEIEKVICLLRRQDRLIASGYAQDVKDLAHKDPLSISPGGYTVWYDWLELQRAYTSAMPAARFVPLEFDHLRRSGTLLPRWKQELGVSSIATDEPASSAEPVNPSLSGEMVEVCRAANELGLPSLSALALEAARRGLVGSPYMLPASMTHELRSGFAARNDEFVAQLDAPRGFEDYTTNGWKLEDVKVPQFRPEIVAQLLALALEIRSEAPADPAAAASDTLASLPRNSREQAIGGNVAAIPRPGKDDRAQQRDFGLGVDRIGDRTSARERRRRVTALVRSSRDRAWRPGSRRL